MASVLLTGSVAAAQAPPEAPPAPAPAVHAPQALNDAAPGASVTLSGANLAKTQPAVKLRSRANRETDAAVRSVADTQIVFMVPEADPGRYSVMVAFPGGQPQYVAALDVMSVAPVIRRAGAISPWGKLLAGRFDFELVGERLTATPCTDTAGSCVLRLVVDDEQMDLPRCSRPSSPATRPPVQQAALTSSRTASEEAPKTQLLSCRDALDVPVQQACFTPGEPAGRVCVHGFTTFEHGGLRRMQVSTAGALSTAMPVHVTRITPRTIKWVSFAAFLVLIGAVMAFGRHAHLPAAGNSTRLRLVSWALLDEQTNSYSLSKLQVLLWAAVVAYCYVYFYLANVFVQGHFDVFPTLPGNFEWLIGVTGGTSMLTTMLSRSRGSKGAGASVPTASDLISTGGVLAPDRAQYLAWTLIGCVGYVVLVLRNPPESLTVLPELDPKLLTAMGLSALVYVGGKAVRLPGPIMNEVATAVAPQQAPATITFTVKGQNLHKDAVVSIDGSPVVATRIAAAPPAGTADQALVSDLTITVTGTLWNTGDHLLRLTNIDGQFAEKWFAVDTPVLSNVTDAAGVADTVVAQTSAVAVTVTGRNLRSGSTGEWLPSGATEPTLIDAAQVSVVSATEARLTCVPGTAKGSAVLTISSPRGIRASRQVTVT